MKEKTIGDGIIADKLNTAKVLSRVVNLEERIAGMDMLIQAQGSRILLMEERVEKLLSARAGTKNQSPRHPPEENGDSLPLRRSASKIPYYIQKGWIHTELGRRFGMEAHRVGVTFSQLMKRSNRAISDSSMAKIAFPRKEKTGKSNQQVSLGLVLLAFQVVGAEPPPTDELQMLVTEHNNYVKFTKG